MARHLSLLVCLAAFISPQVLAQQSEYEFDVRRFEGARLVEPSVRNLSILSIIPLEDFRREVEANFDYTDQGVEQGSCYYYSRVLNREPWETTASLAARAG